ncbi:MAG: alpha/beta fold hydrolase [Acidobacteriota bacterium]
MTSSRSRSADRTLYLLVLAILAVCALGAAVDAAEAQEPQGYFPGATTKLLVDGWSANGFQRSYRLHVPTRHEDTSPTPLVVALHGGVATAKTFEDQSRFSPLADVEGFLVAYPNGIGIGPLLRHWNGGYCCARAMKKQIDDIGFINAVIEDVAGRFQIDRSRIYVVGYSNGGMLAYNYAAEHPDKVAAVGIFASAPGLELQDESYWVPRAEKLAATPVPLIHVHGFDDPRLRWRKPYKTRKKPRPEAFKPERSAAYWAEVNGCTGEPSQRQFLDGAVTRWDWCSDSSSSVALLGLEGWGHEWPSQARTSKKRRSRLRDFDAAVEMWAFFQKHSR